MSIQRTCKTLCAAAALALAGAGAQAQFGRPRPIPIGGGVVFGGFGPMIVGSQGVQYAAPYPGTMVTTPRGDIVAVGPDGTYVSGPNGAYGYAPRTESEAAMYGTRLIPRTSDTVDARTERDGRLLVQWQGEPQAVSALTFALLDKDHKVIKQTTIRRQPTQARFTLTNKTAFYRVVVTYVNGTTTSVTSPL